MFTETMVMEALGKMSTSFLLNSKTYVVTDKESLERFHSYTTEKQIYEGFLTGTKINTNTHTIRHERLYLKDSDGRLHDVELTKRPIGKGKGNEITLVWPMEKDPDEKAKPLLGIWVNVKEQHDMGNILAIKNHHTGKCCHNEPLMRAIVRNPWWVVIPVVAIILFVVIRVLDKRRCRGG
jgi:hypothetical protein